MTWTIQNDTAKTKLALKFQHHQIMVDGVKSSGQVKQAERGNVPIVSSEQKVDIDYGLTLSAIPSEFMRRNFLYR